MPSFARRLLRYVCSLLFRMRITGEERLATYGGLVIANHNAPMDWLLLALILPKGSVLALTSQETPSPLVRRLLADLEWVVVDLQAPEVGLNLLTALHTGRVVATFPEGDPSPTGLAIKTHPWPLLLAERAGVPLLPIHLEGTQHSRLAPSQRSHRRSRFPRVTIYCGQPRLLQTQGSMAARRQEAVRMLCNLLQENSFAAIERRRTLWQAFAQARARHGGNHPIAEDATGASATYTQLLTRAAILSRRLTPITRKGELVGMLLPTSLGALITFLAMQRGGRVPAILNFSAGPRAMLQACAAGEVKLVCTSRLFVAKAGLRESLKTMEKEVSILYLEDLRKQIGVMDLLAGKLIGWFPHLFDQGDTISPDAPATALFTSGSEGAPKGVLLSHANILANCAQVYARLDFNSRDLFLNVLPIFHSFGLTVGTLAPILNGVRLYLYPTPLEYQTIAEKAFTIGATLFAGTDTFLTGYGRVAGPTDFRSLRLVFAGAEPLRASTRQLWMDRFGVRILEGYGTTEASPVLAVNTPDAHRVGTVGRLLPAIEAHLTPVPGIAMGGRLSVRGPNIMLGYLIGTEGVCQPTATELGQGWYDTGDIAVIDDDGFITLLGRAKRFAKIGGEMVSLAAVEELCSRLWPERRHAAIALPDPGRGERIVLLTEQPTATRAMLLAQAREEGTSELTLPKRLFTTDAIPLTGTGKTDYSAVKQYIEKLEQGKI